MIGKLVLLIFLIARSEAFVQNCNRYEFGTEKCLKCSNGFDFDQIKNMCILRAVKDSPNENKNQDKSLNAVQNQNQKSPQSLKLISVLPETKSRILTSTSNCLVPDPSNPTGCLICQDNYYPSNSTCVPVSKNCLQYNKETGRCFECKFNYTLQQNRCVHQSCVEFDFSKDNCIKCLAGYSLNTETESCIKSGIDNCFVYKNDTECSVCKEDFYLSESKICVKLPYACISFDIATKKCTNCLQNYYLTTKGSCEMNSLDPYCQKYQNGKCKQCINRYYLGGVSRCVPVSQLCKNFTSKGKCTQCYPGYTLTLNTGICTIAKIPYCKVQTSNDQCTECCEGFYLKKSSGKCEVINLLCRTYNQFTGQCLSCYPKYNLLNGSCLTYGPDPKCKYYDFMAQRCIQCQENHVLLKSSSQCVFVNPLCKRYNETNGDCLKCFDGYHLEKNQCKIGIWKTIQNCLDQVDGKCLICKDRYFANADGSSCLIVNELCKTYNLLNGNCTSCYPGYILRNYQCEAPSISSLENSKSTIQTPKVQIIMMNDQNCQIPLNSTNCQLCKFGYYPKQGICQQVNILCQTWNTTDGACLSCYPGYSLFSRDCEISTNIRIINIPDEKANQNIANPQTTTQPKPLPITTINTSSNISKPTASSTTKIIPVSSSRDVNCVKYKAGSCVQCPQGYYLYQNRSCIQVDPLCKTYSSANGQCLSCYDGYRLTNKKCEMIRPIRIPFCQALSPINNLCESCSFGYYLSPTQTECKYVSLLCTRYMMDSGDCLDCLAGYVLQDGQCIYPAVGIDPNCMRYSGGFCLVCKWGFTLNNYKCTDNSRIYKN